MDHLAGAGKQVDKVSCGFAHTIAICQSYDVLVWGSGFKGKLGLGDDHNRLTPTPIPALKRAHQARGVRLLSHSGRHRHG